MITGQTTSNTYQGDGSNRVWNISFEFTDSSQIKFKVNGEEVTTNYSVNPVAKTLTYPTVASELDPLTSADEIEIYRDTEITQNIDFTNGGPLNAEMIEDGLDKLTMISQEIKAIAESKADESGVKIMPDGKDLDDLKEEGVYLVPNPTSTVGMPTQPNFNTSVTGSYAIVKVTVPQLEKGTYFVYQEMTLFWVFVGANEVSAPHLFVRNLTDYTYTTKTWKKLNNDIITIQKSGTEATLSYGADAGYQIIMNPSGYGNVTPSTGITSLSITNYANAILGKARIIFKAGSGFALTVIGKDYWIGTKPTTWTEGNIYMITIEAGFMKCEDVTMS